MRLDRLRDIRKIALQLIRLDHLADRDIEAIALLVQKFVEHRHVAQFRRPFGEPVEEARVASLHMDRQDRQVVLLGKPHRRGLPRPLVQLPVRPIGDAAGGKQHHDLAVLHRAVGQHEGFPRLQLALVLLAPFHRDDHLGEPGIDPDGIPIGKDHQVGTTILEEVEDGNAVRNPGRVVADQDEAARSRNALGIRHAHVELQRLAQVLERLKPGHSGDVVGEFDRSIIPKQGVEKWPHHRPQRMPDDPLTTLGNERINDMTRLSLRNQRNCFGELPQRGQ